MEYNLSNLSPEEKDSLLAKLIQKYESEPTDEVAPATDNSDMQQDLETIEPLVKVMELLINKVEELEERVCYTEKLVIDDLFGGIEKLYKGNLRAKGIEDFRSKYAEHFAPYEDSLKELAPDEDWGSTLYDMLETMKSEEGFTDEAGHDAVMNAVKAIGDKIAKIKGTTPEVATEIKPVDGKGIAVEKTTVSAEPVDATAQFIEKVKKMKSKATKSLF